MNSTCVREYRLIRSDGVCGSRRKANAFAVRRVVAPTKSRTSCRSSESAAPQDMSHLPDHTANRKNVNGASAQP